MKYLNKFLTITYHEFEGIPYHNIVNNTHSVTLAALATHPDIGEPVLQTAVKTWWNTDCISAVLNFVRDGYGEGWDVAYITFDKEHPADRKTPIYTPEGMMFENSSTIRWYGAWRQFCVSSSEDHFRMGELEVILDKLKELNQK